MANRMKRSRLGVIIGRFQVDAITGGHRDLIENVAQLHERVLILVGCSPIPGTKPNPMDYATREKMIRDAFPGITCLPIMDQSSDELWSQQVDATVRTIFPIGSVCIYGGRDSFLPYYSGMLDAVEFPATDYRPGEDIRESIGNSVPCSQEGRRGVIYSTQNQYPRAFMCVDVIIKQHDGQIIAGRRPSDQGRLRLPGGFVDPGEPLESAVRREVHEEVGCSVENIKYITSRNTEDWRFRKGTDGLTTALFMCDYQFGPTTGGDDLPNTFWLDIVHHPDRVEKFIPGHQELVKAYLDAYERIAL